MHETELIPVIMCGGDGTRLWPLSRASAPKPFLPLIGDKTLFQLALDRVTGQTFSDPIIVTGSAHVDLVTQQLGRGSVREIVVEPEPRGTAAAVALAAARASPDSILLVCPSDHHIESRDAFLEAVGRAAALAAQGWIVSIGVAAQEAETRFGYIRRGEALGFQSFRIEEFVEKPQPDAAEAFVASGQFAWNSGIFAFRASHYLDELQRYRPAFAKAVTRSVQSGREGDCRFDPEPLAFASLEAESVDTAVMENTDRAALVMCDAGWSDVGDWRSLYKKRPKDSEGNSVRGRAELLDCRNVLVDTDGPHVHLLGLEDVVVVVDGDDILIANAAHSQKVMSLKATKRRKPRDAQRH